MLHFPSRQNTAWPACVIYPDLGANGCRWSVLYLERLIPLLPHHMDAFCSLSSQDIQNRFAIVATLGMPTPEQDEDVLLAEELDEPSQLIVYNDDVNTFDHVIETLIHVCNHTPEQAEQCTWLIHYKGKCCVKMGDWDKLASMRSAICDRGISAEVV